MAKGKHSRKHHRKQRGGLAPDSAWGSVLNNYGDGWTQFMNSLTLSNNQNVASASSNDIVPIGRPNANDPSSSMLNNKQSGGKKGKKGGFLGIGAILEQAVVPFGLFGMQHSYGKSRRSKSSGNSKTRRYRK